MKKTPLFIAVYLFTFICAWGQQSDPSNIQIMLHSSYPPFVDSLQKNDYDNVNLPSRTQLPANGNFLVWQPYQDLLYFSWNDSGRIWTNNDIWGWNIKQPTHGHTYPYLNLADSTISWDSAAGVSLVGLYPIKFSGDTISLQTPLPVHFGGTGDSTLTNKGVLIGSDTNRVLVSNAFTDGQILIGQNIGIPQPKTMGQDGTLSDAGALRVVGIDNIPIDLGAVGGDSTVLQYSVATGEWEPINLETSGLELLGDVTGRINNNTVIKWWNRTISGAAPDYAAFYLWDTTAHEFFPHPLSIDVVTLSNGQATVQGIQTIPIDQPSIDKFIPYFNLPANTIEWESLSSSVALSGDVTGTANANTVTAIQGHNFSSALPVDSYIPIAQSGNTWLPKPIGQDASMLDNGFLTVKGIQTIPIYKPVNNNYIAYFDSTADSIKWAAQGATVTTVTATYPVKSTGGTTPVISLQTPLPVVYGGTKDTIITNHRFVVGNDTNGLRVMPNPSDGQIITGNSGGDPSWVTMSQDGSITNLGALTVTGIQTIPIKKAVNNNYVATFDSTADTIKWLAAQGGAPTGTAGGDLSGTYPNPVVFGIRYHDSLLTAANDTLPVFTPPQAQFWRCNASANAINVILPASNTVAFTNGHSVAFFEKIDSTANSVTVKPKAGDSINGSTASITLTNQHDRIWLVNSSNKNWSVYSKTIGGFSAITNITATFPLVASPAAATVNIADSSHHIYLKASQAWGVLAGNVGTATGDTNLFIGDSVGGKNTSGDLNTAIGAFSEISNTTGSENTALGVFTLPNNTSGRGNTAIGAFADSANTTGNNNTTVGAAAMYANTTGSNNSALGVDALTANTTGSWNTAIGMFAALHITSGDSNTAIGGNSLKNDTTGSYNFAGAYNALFNTQGHDNTGLGYTAGSTNTTGNQNTYLGSQSNCSSGTLSNSTALGYSSSVTQSNEVQLGNGSVTLVNTSGNVTSTAGVTLSGTASTLTLNASVGTSGQVLKSAGAGATPTWSSEAATFYTLGNTATQVQNGTVSKSLDNLGGVATAAIVAGDGHQTVMPVSGTMKNLYIVTKNAPAAGQTYTFTIFDNRVATGLAVTISAGTTTGNSGATTIAVTQGHEYFIESKTSATSGSLTGWDGGVEVVTP